MKINNKKSQHDYYLTDFLEVGIKFTGQELKSIMNSKGGAISLKESYISIDNDECYLKQAHISDTDEPLRPKKLLLKKSQIQKFKKLSRDNGFTLMLKNIYISDSKKLKGTMCLAKGKNNSDKRQVLKEKDVKMNELRRWN